MSREEFPESSQFDESSAESNSSSEEESVRADQSDELFVEQDSKSQEEEVRVAVIKALEAIAVWQNNEQKRTLIMGAKVMAMGDSLPSPHDNPHYSYLLGQTAGRIALLTALSDRLVIESRDYRIDLNKGLAEEE